MAMSHLIAKPQFHLLLWLLLSPALVLSRVLVSMPTPALPEVTGTKGRAPLHCPQDSMCGDTLIPYPFSIIKGCSWNEAFAINCNHTFNPPRPYYREYEVKKITAESGEMVVSAPIAHICYSSYNTTISSSHWTYNFTSTPFEISAGRNTFTGIGCYTLALLGDREDAYGDNSYYLSGCVTTCTRLDDAAKERDKCTGLGCCQIPTLPRNLDIVTVHMGRINNIAWKYSSCSYAFLAEKTWYNFSRNHLNATGVTPFHNELGDWTVPLVLDWAIPMSKNSACRSVNSEHENVRNGSWYRCRCRKGYTGNPYVIHGCKDIGECELRQSDPTKYKEQYHLPSGSKCINTDGDYTWKCDFGRIGTECRPIFSAKTAAIFAILVACFLLVLLRKEHKRRVRRGFFDKNGGEILKHMNINTFTELQLEKITNHYDTPIGRGAFGKVFRGTTHNNLQVAVKRSILEGEKPCHDHDLVNEIAVQFEINHANLVRLIGCCLETEVPMLVFEYISNGSLYNMLHCASKQRSLSLSARLDIAIGSAKALAYMHSHGGRSLVHGDVKTANILLGANLTPKVSDFGSTKHVSVTRHAKWCVTGDMSYIDPMYLKTGHFMEKSDVYSFGVVLLELITRKMARYGNSSLPVDFLRSYKEDGNGRMMYDRDILFEGDAESHCHVDCLDQIGMLAVRCLKEDVDDRPTMAEVVEELMQVKVRACSN